MCAIFALRAGELIEMDEQPFAAEKDLQRYLEAHPELLSAEAAEDDRRSWLLVRREMGVADREDAGDRWSVDHLFVDQDAIPTFVEVKRSSNMKAVLSAATTATTALALRWSVQRAVRRTTGISRSVFS